MRDKHARKVGANVFAFFALALGISWVVWIAAVFLDLQWGEAAGTTFVAIGGAAPAIATLLVLFSREDKKHRHDYWHRLIAARAIRPAWYAVALLLPAAVVAVSILVSVGFGGSWEQFIPIKELRASATAFIPFAIYVFLVGPLPEELGWRGYALHELLKKFNPLVASLIVAAFWSAWHVPLFFIADYPLSEISGDAARMATYLATFFPLSILFTWIFIGAAHRTLSAILFHFAINFFGMMFITETRTEMIIFVVYALIALGVLLRMGTTLGAQPRS